MDDGMIPCSHWGLFYVPTKPEKPEWAATAPASYDSEYLHGCYQHLNFGPYLP